MKSPAGVTLAIAQDQVKPEMPKERQYTTAILNFWRRIDFHYFNMPVESYPWGGRSQHYARRIVVSNYIEPEDVLKAVWVQEQTKRSDPNWRAKEPGMSYISALLRERSGDRWQIEVAELAAKLPSLMAYMDQEWGEESRTIQASERRDMMCVVKHEDFTLPQKTIIGRILRDIANQRWPADETQPQDQTQAWAGECSLFVDQAWRPLEQAGIVFSDEGMIGKFDQLDFQATPPPGLSMKEVSELGIEDHINHHWLVSNGHHFDASCPDGVDSIFDLRGIRQTAAEVLERDHPKVLQQLCSTHEWWRESVLLLVDFRNQRAAVEAPESLDGIRPQD